MRHSCVFICLIFSLTACRQIDDPTISVPVPTVSPSNAASSLPVAPRDEQAGTPEPIFQTYTVQQGDGLITIADRFNLKPETILFCNWEILGGNPHALQVGQALRIPQTDGVLHRWQAGDTLEAVAEQYAGSMVEICFWPNHGRYVRDGRFAPDDGNWIFVPAGRLDFDGVFEPRVTDEQ